MKLLGTVLTTWLMGKIMTGSMKLPYAENVLTGFRYQCHKIFHLLVELPGHLDTTPNYLLGVEEKEVDSFILKAVHLLRQIDDDKAKEILLAQINALAHM